MDNGCFQGSMASFKLHDTYIPSCLFCTQKDGKSTEVSKALVVLVKQLQQTIHIFEQLQCIILCI